MEPGCASLQNTGHERKCHLCTALTDHCHTETNKQTKNKKKEERKACEENTKQLCRQHLAFVSFHTQDVEAVVFLQYLKVLEWLSLTPKVDLHKVPLTGISQD